MLFSIVSRGGSRSRFRPKVSPIRLTLVGPEDVSAEGFVRRSQVMNKTFVIGLGNILLSDDGVGVHVARLLKETYRFTPRLDTVDGGTLGLDLLTLFDRGDKILFVDAVDFGREPGFLGEIEGDDIHYFLQSTFSVHDIGFSDLLFAAKWVDRQPRKVSLFGIQPESLAMGLEMTGTIRNKIAELTGRIVQKLETWGFTVRPAFAEAAPAYAKPPLRRA